MKINNFRKNATITRNTRSSIYVLTKTAKTAAMMSETAYQLVCTHFLKEAILSSDNNSFRNVANGPDGSTSRHFWNTSQ